MHRPLARADGVWMAGLHAKRGDGSVRVLNRMTELGRPEFKARCMNHAAGRGYIAPKSDPCNIAAGQLDLTVSCARDEPAR